MDFQTKIEIPKKVEKLFADYKADENNKKIHQEIIGYLQRLADRMYADAASTGNIVLNGVKAQKVLDDRKIKPEQVEEALSGLIDVYMTAEGVNIQY